MIRVFAIYDSKGKVFTHLHSALNGAVAERDFKTACNAQQTDYFKYPDDYALFECGAFNQDSGTIESHKTPIKIADARQLLNPS